MGPTLLIDKSTIQSLSRAEIDFLYKHYSVVLPPILIVEIISDYAKYSHDGEARTKVGVLSNKLAGNCNVNMDWRRLVVEELMGAHIPMDGRPVLEAAGVGYTANGEKSVVIEESPWQVVARHWQEGRFTEEDINFAQGFRAERDAINIIGMAKELGKDADLPVFKNLDEIVMDIKQSLLHPTAEFHGEALRLLLEFLRVDKSFAKRVMDRWATLGKPPLHKFSPYGFFCYSLINVVAVAMIQNHVPTGKNSHLLVDIEYLFYLPFCQAFCSSDKFHKSLSPLFMRTDQYFVAGQAMKEDLHNIFYHWESLDDTVKREFAIIHRYRPPRVEGSVASALWDRFMDPAYPKPKKDTELSKEEEKVLLEKLKKALLAAEKSKKPIGAPEYNLYKGNGSS